MKVRFLAIAQQELDDAVAWYNEQAGGLGKEFLDELDRAVRRAVAFPMSSPEITSGLRRCLEKAGIRPAKGFRFLDG